MRTKKDGSRYLNTTPSNLINEATGVDWRSKLKNSNLPPYFKERPLKTKAGIFIYFPILHFMKTLLLFPVQSYTLFLNRLKFNFIDTKANASLEKKKQDI